MDNIKKEYQRIGVSLQYGTVFTKNWYIAISVCMLLLLLLPMGDIILLFKILNGVEQNLTGTIVGMAVMAAFFLFFFGSAIYVLCNKIRLNKKICLWLEDAVEMYARTATIDSIHVRCFPIDATKLRVEFEFDEKVIIRTSEQSNGKSGKKSLNDYSFVLTLYANKQVKIFYSPKYDQVMLLKNKRSKK